VLKLPLYNSERSVCDVIGSIYFQLVYAIYRSNRTYALHIQRPTTCFTSALECVLKYNKVVWQIYQKYWTIGINAEFAQLINFQSGQHPFTNTIKSNTEIHLHTSWDGKNHSHVQWAWGKCGQLVTMWWSCVQYWQYVPTWQYTT